MVKDIGIVIFQLVLLWVINELGYAVVHLFHIPLPGNVIGMVILCFLLATGMIQLRWIERAANLLIKHLAFFFIPIAVGLIKFSGLFMEHGAALIIAIVASSLIGIYITGIVSQSVAQRKRRTE